MKRNRIIGGEFAIDINSLSSNNTNIKSDISNEILYSSGRCALYMILKDIEIELGKKTKIFIPNYLCDSITKTIIDAGWYYRFYSIDTDLYPNLNDLLKQAKDNSNNIFLLINYFGIVSLTQTVLKIKKEISGAIIIIDNVQAFYEPTIDMADYTFTSYRKWFPCPDGAKVIKRNNASMQETSFKYNNTFSQYKFSGNHLKIFSEYLDDNISLELLKKGEDILEKEYLCRCSKITTALFPLLDLEEIARLRKNNAKLLHEHLNQISIPHAYDENSVPLFIPIFIENRDIVKKRFFENNVFTPIHWPFRNEKISGNSELYNTELSLICDQRYDEEDMILQINVLKQIL